MQQVVDGVDAAVVDADAGALGERPGGLRLLTKALKLAALYAKDEAINVQFLKAAFTELEGIE